MNNLSKRQTHFLSQCEIHHEDVYFCHSWCKCHKQWSSGNQQNIWLNFMSNIFIKKKYFCFFIFWENFFFYFLEKRNFGEKCLWNSLEIFFEKILFWKKSFEKIILKFFWKKVFWKKSFWGKMFWNFLETFFDKKIFGKIF